VLGAEAGSDQLAVNTGAGNDNINASTLLNTGPRLTIDAGAGNDTINGSQGADTILAGDGNDTVIGDNGNDTAFLGAGNDTFTWVPGDGSDVVEGRPAPTRWTSTAPTSAKTSRSRPMASE
jgi:Ca2+-binding RTX toxin-like protein